MRRGFTISTWTCLLLLGGWLGSSLLAQAPAVKYRFENGSIIATIDNSLQATVVDSLLQLIGSSKSETDSLARLGRKAPNGQGWKLQACTDFRIEYRKPLKELKGVASLQNNGWALDLDLDAPPTWSAGVNYGINRFKVPSVTHSKNQVTFRLYGYREAKAVHLAGTFNQWSVLATPMRSVGRNWEVTVELPPGRHLYKFVVDGKWLLDPANSQTERESSGYQNSVYYLPNYTFVLEGFPEAKSVFVAGSFNNWAPEELALEQRDGRWELPLFLIDGTHSYKFIVDGEWITDPANPRQLDDGYGNMNSVLVMGETFRFGLDGFPEARRVCVAGDFNNWNRTSDCLDWNGRRWVLPYALQAGNYKYELVVDGQKMPDPANPHRTLGPDGPVSLLAVEPNYTFELPGYANATSVVLCGNFNDWFHQGGYAMRRADGAWKIDVHLPPGKVLYKFRVDGEWVADPNNSLWERNEFLTRNSVLWVR